MIMEGKLTAKQEAFCQAMIKNNHNQYLSYKEAFPDANETTCRTNGNRLMKKDAILKRICELEEEAWKQACITPAKIARELAEQAFSPVDNESGLTYGVKQNAIKLLQQQMGLQVQKIEAEVKTTVIDVNIEEPDGE